MKLNRREFIQATGAALVVPIPAIAKPQPRLPYIEAGQVVSMIHWEPYPVPLRFIGATIVDTVWRWDHDRQTYPVVLRNQGYSPKKPYMGKDGHFAATIEEAYLFNDEHLASAQEEGLYDLPPEEREKFGSFHEWIKLKRGLV